jgi:protein phosphatase PTC1
MKQREIALTARWPRSMQRRSLADSPLTPQYLLDALLSTPDLPVPDLLNKTFHVVDSRLSHLSQAGKTQSGCTAVTAFLRVEHAVDTEPRGFVNPGLTVRGLMDGKGEEELEAQTSVDSKTRRGSMGGGSGSMGGAGNEQLRRKSSGRRIRDFVGRLTGSSGKDDGEIEEVTPEPKVDAIEPKSEHGLRRVLYTANVGDARAVLW